MKLKSFGCSYIFGSELSDDVLPPGPNKPASQLTWPARLAQRFGLAYECHAIPATGNLRILDQLLAQIHTAEPALYCIGWTYIDRFDYQDPGTQEWTAALPQDTTPAAHAYYRNLHSQYRDKLASLTYIKTAIDALRQAQAQFVMTYMDPLLFETQWHTSAAMEYLQHSIQPYMTNFSGHTFDTWSKAQGHAIGPAGHPLDDAHQAAADYIIALYKQNTNDC
jgi:hypothetical protein